MVKYTFDTWDEKEMVTEIEAERLAKKACEDYMTSCNVKDLEECQLAAQKMLAIAQDLFATMHDGDLKMHNIQ